MGDERWRNWLRIPTWHPAVGVTGDGSPNPVAEFPGPPEPGARFFWVDSACLVPVGSESVNSNLSNYYNSDSSLLENIKLRQLHTTLRFFFKLEAAVKSVL